MLPTSPCCRQSGSSDRTFARRGGSARSSRQSRCGRALAHTTLSLHPTRSYASCSSGPFTARALDSPPRDPQLIIFDEIERQFLTEFDYRLEAEQVATVNRNMRPFSRQVAVPRAYPQYCSKVRA